MKQAVKGKKGFQVLPKDEIKSKRVTTFLSENEYKKINDYALKHNLKVSDLIRQLINKHL